MKVNIFQFYCFSKSFIIKINNSKMQIISKELIGIIWKLLESYTEYGSNDNPYNDPSSVSDYGSDQYASLDEDPCMVSLN